MYDLRRATAEAPRSRPASLTTQPERSRHRAKSASPRSGDPKASTPSTRPPTHPRQRRARSPPSPDTRQEAKPNPETDAAAIVKPSGRRASSAPSHNDHSARRCTPSSGEHQPGACTPACVRESQQCGATRRCPTWHLGKAVSQRRLRRPRIPVAIASNQTATIAVRTAGATSPLSPEAAPLSARLPLSARFGSDDRSEQCLCRRGSRAVQHGGRSTCSSPNSRPSARRLVRRLGLVRSEGSRSQKPSCPRAHVYATPSSPRRPRYTSAPSGDDRPRRPR